MLQWVLAGVNSDAAGKETGAGIEIKVPSAAAGAAVEAPPCRGSEA